MTPFLNPVNLAQANYNAAHTSTRCCVERAIGVLKQRFRFVLVDHLLSLGKHVVPQKREQNSLKLVAIMSSYNKT